MIGVLLIVAGILLFLGGYAVLGLVLLLVGAIAFIFDNA